MLNSVVASLKRRQWGYPLTVPDSTPQSRGRCSKDVKIGRVNEGENKGYIPVQPGMANTVGGWRPPMPSTDRAPLKRAREISADMPSARIAGVCSGLSVHLGVPVTLVRVLMVLAGLFGGTGVILYVWLWAMVPEDDGQRIRVAGAPIGANLATKKQGNPHDASRGQLLLAGVLILLVALVAALFAWTNVARLLDVASAGLIIAGLGLVWSQGAHIQQWRSSKFLAIVGAGIGLLFTGVLFLAGRGDPSIILLRGGLIGAVVVAGVLFALLPLWLRTSKDLSVSREREVREAERADIAAHLHDSVLQTLTLIRSAASDPARVRALALAEERELRSWLYTGRTRANESLSQAIRDTVEQVESRHGIPVDVVAVGDTVPGPGELAMIAAIGEAVTNAVRHGEPPVSVYVEVRPHVIEAFIKDSGSGFDLASISSDRHGVRDSIIGRMERVGGKARIRMLQSGTEVELSLPRD